MHSTLKCLFFSVIGKYINESGGPYILSESGVLQKESLNSFLTGKSYNRNRRIHPTLGVSMEILHLQSFIDTCEISEQEISNLHKHLKSKELNNPSKEVKEFIEIYKKFSRDTLNGEHGMTPKYWMEYIQMMHLYHEFERSIRTGDFELYKYCLPKLADYFFAFNHPNYARWLVKYHDSLLKLEKSHPNVYQEFKQGCFAIKRTTKPFSRIPIDLTLEQTINADAASQRTGILAITNSISARQRWARNHFLRTKIISHVYESLGFEKKEDISRELKDSRIKRNAEDLYKVISCVEENINPFKIEDKDNLYNIGSGKSCSPDTATFLLNVVEIGRTACEKFTQECADNPARFEERIARQRVKTFQSEARSYKISSNKSKLTSTEMVRDVFDGILWLSLEQNIDMAETLTYPLTPVPLSLCHPDGRMQKTPKSTLLKELESRVLRNDPNSIHVTIIDAFFYLHLHKELPNTFGEIAHYIMKKICNMKGNEIHLVFDKIVKPSIKDIERDVRSGNDRDSRFEITGTGQKRPNKWLEALRNDNFKIAINRFLVREWGDNKYAEVLKEKILYVTEDDHCYIFKTVNGVLLKYHEIDLYNTHEEADSKMIYHLRHVPDNSNVVIRTVDTDVLVIALGSFDCLENNINLWINVGTSGNNTLRYVNVNKLHEVLGDRLCRSLPFFHALTGSDYTASFSRKGKIRPLKILEKHPEIQDIFARMGFTEEIESEDMVAIEKFVCEMYGRKSLSKVDEARFNIFLCLYKPKANGLLNTVKSMDGSCLPPCSRVLRQKALRSNFVAGKWNSAWRRHPPMLTPTNCGWILSDESYDIKWFEGDACPKSFDIICEETATENEGGTNIFLLLLPNINMIV